MLNQIKLVLDFKGYSKMNETDSTVMNHYKACLKFNGKQMTIDFYTGMGWTKEPNVKDIMNCLLMDYNCKEMTVNDYIDEFFGNYGYGNEKQAKKIMNKINQNVKKLERVFTCSQIEKMQELLADY